MRKLDPIFIFHMLVTVMKRNLRNIKRSRCGPCSIGRKTWAEFHWPERSRSIKTWAEFHWPECSRSIKTWAEFHWPERSRSIKTWAEFHWPERSRLIKM